MFKFSTTTKDYEFDVNPTLEEMENDYKRVKKLDRTQRGLKIAYGFNEGKEIEKIVIVSDSKLYDRAIEFVKDGCDEILTLHPLRSFDKVFREIGEVIEKAKEKENIIMMKKISNMVEEKQYEVDVVDVNNGIEDTEVAIADNKATSGQESDEQEKDESIPVLSNSTLPVINPSDKKVALCVRDNFALVMMPIYCQETKVMEGCKFYLEDIATGIPQIGVGREIRMEKAKLLGADNHSVMSSVNRFIINFSDDDLKLAFDRAKIFLENANSMVGVSSSMNIIDAYREVISYAIEKASQEETAKVLEIDRKCKYNKKENIVAINDRYFKELVEEIGIGYTPVVFCKKLMMVEAHFGQKLILHNGGRYARNTVGNRRFYNFYIVEEIMGKGGVA